jgi:formate-dependent nitrite reductase membrane component NrfD
VNRNRLIKVIVYLALALVFCGLLLHDVGQTTYWVVKYKLDLDWLTWFYFGINIICRSIVIGLFIILAKKSSKKLTKCKGRVSV